MAIRPRGRGRAALVVVLAASCLAPAALWSGIEPPAALKKCLTGRCKQGETAKGKLPEYNYGWGYTCDLARSNAYDRCRAQNKTCEECTKVGDEEREKCKKKENICGYVYDQCIDDRCRNRAQNNRWECWEKEGGGKFGYWDVGETGKPVFFPVQPADATEVPEAAWKGVCEKRKKRCEDTLKAKPGDKVLPIDDGFPSAACAGHNCHHAVADVCACLKKEGIADVRVVVFDPPDSKTCLPCPPGNLYHSMITIPHPTDANKRCLIESQKQCPDEIDENCCFSTANDGADFANLATRGCRGAKTGPFQKPRDLKNITVYPDCSKFLEKRGTCAAGLPPHGITRMACEERAEGEFEIDMPQCFLTCGPEGTWVEVWEDTYSPCGSGRCVPPEGMTCPLPPDDTTCPDADTCSEEPPAPEPPPFYVGVCAPSPSPSPTPSPSPSPSPSPGPSPSPTPLPSPNL